MLHIVTLKALPMTTFRFLTTATLGLAVLLAACTANKNPAEISAKTQDLVFTGEPEPVKGKIDVYQSMARAAKYNVDAAGISLSKKIYNQNPNLKPEDIIANVLNSNISDSNPLYNMSRVLDFAVIYAMTNLDAGSEYVNNNFYNKSAQHLALAAIRAHQDAWWADRHEREIERMIRQQTKIVKELAAKEERLGRLSKEDVHYKKNLEVALLKLAELQKELAFNKMEFAQLVKVGPKEIDLEGRHFYQLEDFDKTYTLEIFQEAAVRNRNEFAKGKESLINYSFDDVRGNVIRKYPLVERLDINGLNIEDDVYYKELQNRVLQIADNLMTAVTEYRRAKPGTATKEAFKRRAYDELGAAILEQVEINFRLVERADIDYENIQKEIALQKQELRQFNKNYKMSVDQKLELLNAQIKLVETERQAAQILAERAVALRSLYFNAGFTPFSKAVLKAPVKDVVAVLKTGFNRDVVEMLAAAAVPARRNEEPQGNDWAKKPNWLEDLMKNPGTPAKASGAAKQQLVSRFSPYGPEADSLKVLQLGAYEQKENAAADWQKLSEQFVILKNYQPQLLPANGSGRVLYRLVISDEEGGLRQICNQMRAAGVDCLLR